MISYFKCFQLSPLSSLHALSHQTLLTVSEKGMIISPISQIMKLGYLNNLTDVSYQLSSWTGILISVSTKLLIGSNQQSSFRISILTSSPINLRLIIETLRALLNPLIIFFLCNCFALRKSIPHATYIQWPSYSCAFHQMNQFHICFLN